METRAFVRSVVVVVVVAAGCRQSSSLGSLLTPAPDGRLGLGQINASLSRALQAEYRGRADRKAPPVSLVPADGGELALRGVEATVTIEGPLAHTELHLTFHNAEARQREGRFAITLPAGAVVGRFAMKIDTGWREARIVSRQKGREVYETFLHRRVDPALLEQDLGNRFSARVFPIAPAADKEIILAYDHQVSATRPYLLALDGLPAVPRLSVAIDHDGDRRTIRRDGARPEDIAIAIPDGSGAVAGGEAFVARVQVPAEEAAAPLDRVLILVDTSASRAAIMGRQLELVRGLVAALPADAMVSVAAFDHDVTEVFHGAPGSAGGALAALLDHGALGASDLGAALAWARGSGMTRIVIVGDGTPTLGETDPARLAAIITGDASPSTGSPAPIERIDAVQVGQSLDRATLQVVVRAGRRPGALLDGRDVALVARQLATELLAEREIHVAGATASWPPTTRGVPPGEPLWVFGLRHASLAPIVVEFGDRAVTVTPRDAEPVRARRAVAGAELAELADQLQHATRDDRRVALGDQIERVALAHNLVSARTSLLVLETDADEERMLGSDVPPRVAAPAPPARSETGGDGEVILVTGNAPRIDASSTSQGMTITTEYTRNIPVPGRTFESVLGAAGGAQVDGMGVSFSGATSIENHYVIDGVNTTGLTSGTMGMSGLAMDHAARQLASTAFPFGLPPAPDQRDVPLPAAGPPQYTGTMSAVMRLLARHDREQALETATGWQLRDPADIAATIALGESLEARGAAALAARAYGTIIDLYPNRAELVSAAAQRLDRIGARRLAIDAYRRALRERPDHISIYRLLAYALLRDGRADDALDVLGDGLVRAPRPSVQQILAEDAGIIAAAIVARDPGKRAKVISRMRRGIADRPSLRVVLSWETDANDVDLHVTDRHGQHAYFGARTLPSGGELLDDLTDGYGPEMFVIPRPAAFPYKISAHYYRRGPMGFGIGTAQVIRHDGAGHVTVDDRPFIIQSDGAMIDLGEIR